MAQPHTYLVLKRADLVRMLATAKPAHLNDEIEVILRHKHGADVDDEVLKAAITMPDKDTFEIEPDERGPRQRHG